MSDNREIVGRDRANEAIKERFELLLSRYQNGLEAAMKGCDFGLDCFNLSYYKYHEKGS